MPEEKGISAEDAVSGIPDGAYYVPNFITQEEEEEIIKHVNSVPRPKWTQLTHRRLQNWGGIPHPKGMIAEEMPKWLTKYIRYISSLNVFEKDILPNHALINEYTKGQGIMPHSDGPLFHPIVTTISCGSHTVLDFYKRKDVKEDQDSKLEFSFLLEPRSLLVLRKELYHNYLHAIAERECDEINTSLMKNIGKCGEEYKNGQILMRRTRLSLTIRHVPKTSKLKLRIGK